MNRPLIGIIAGLGAGILWGLVFLAPQILSGFSSIEITFGRIFFFGLLSLLFVKKAYTVFKRFSAKEKLLAVAFSASGFWLYTIFLTYSVQTAGGVITTLTIGLLPITISLGAHGVRSLTPAFTTGLLVIVAGMVSLHFEALTGLFSEAPVVSWTGVLVLMAALAMWTWYSIANGNFLKERPWISMADYTSLMGLLCFAAMALVSVFMLDLPALIRHESFNSFLFWTAIIGLGSTWGAYWLWNICTAYCPPNISGPLIVSETIFGILFTFIYEQRWPTGYEMVALVLFMVGAYMAVMSSLDKEKTSAV